MPKKRKITHIVVIFLCLLPVAFAVYEVRKMMSLSSLVGNDNKLFSKGQNYKRDKSADRQVTLQWDTVPNASSYNIYWRDSKGVNKHNGRKISNAFNPTTIKDLKAGTTYYFVVTAVNAVGESTVSEEISYTVGE